MNMHQLLLGPGRFKQRVVVGRHLTQTRADGDDQISRFDARGQLGVQANADIACIQRVMVVKRVLKAKRIAHWQAPVFSKVLQCLRGLRRPATTACNNEGTLRFQ